MKILPSWKSPPVRSSCAGMFTANTMGYMMEALGLALPGNGTIPAVLSARERLAKEAGRMIMTLVEKDITPDKILTKAAFENAVAIDGARRIVATATAPACDAHTAS